jgi:OOP family OmpA-OmpF porin
MKAKYFATIALAASAAAIALPSAAQAPFDLGGLYLGASVGESKLKDCGLPGCDDKDTAWGAQLGFQFNRYFAAEGGYRDFGKFDFTGGDAKANAWELVAVGSYPLNDQFSVYGKAGGYRGETKVGGLFSAKEHNNDLTYGAGLRYDFTRNVAVRGEWQRYNDLGGDAVGGKRDLDTWNVGVVYTFR